MDLQLLDDVEAIAVAYALHKRHQQKKRISKRRYWVHPINLKRPEEGQFNVNFMVLRAHPEEFIKYYRMSIQSFDELISLCGPFLSKQLTNMRVPISKEERLTITLRYLATGTHYTALHFEFLAGVSTIAKIVQETCDVLCKVLQPLEMTEPTTKDWLDISKGFYEKTNFPNTVGAVCLFISYLFH